MRPEHLELLADLFKQVRLDHLAKPEEFKRYCLGPQLYGLSTSTTRRRTERATPNDRIPKTPPALATFACRQRAEIRAAASGIYDIRGGGTKRHLPHFDDAVSCVNLALSAKAGRLP
jgi:hypothetical protein